MGASMGGTAQIQPVGGAVPMNASGSSAGSTAGGKGGAQSGMPAPNASQMPMFGMLGGGAQGLANNVANAQKPAQQPAQQPNMFNLSSSAIQDAMLGARGEMGFNPMFVQGGSYSPAMMNMAALGGVGAGGTASAQMIDPNQANMTAAQTSAADIQKFMNPYTGEVIDASLADINRASLQQQNQTASEYQKAGAFGGSREALARTVDRENALRQSGQLAGQLRSQGFNTALGAAQQETGLRQQAAAQNAAQQLQALMANQSSGLAASQTNAQVGAQKGIANLNARLAALQGNQSAANAASQFGLGQQLSAALANQGAHLQGSTQRLAAGNQLANIGNLGFNQAQTALGGMQQAGNMQQLLQQQILDAAKGQYGGYTGFPSQALGYYAQALGATQMPQSTTTSRQPGLFDYLTLGMMM